MKFNLSLSLTLCRVGIFSAALAGLASNSHAITAMWDGVSNIKDASDVQTDGTLFGAWTFRNSNSGPQGTGPNAPFSLNGVTFTNVTNAAGSGNVAVSILTAPVANFAKVDLNSTQQTAANATGTSYNSLPNAYKGIVMGTFALLQQGVNRPMTITVSGLAADTTYSVQFWVSWPTGTGFLGGTRFTVKHPIDPLQDVTSPVLDANITNASGGAGQYVSGTFTTGPSEHSVTFVASSDNVSPSGGNAWVNFNAMQIRTVNKNTWFQNSKYGLGINWNIPWPVPVDEVVGVSNSVYNDFVKIKTGESLSDWAKAIRDFDAAGLARQCQIAGASYAIFAVGGSIGLFTSWNNEYESNPLSPYLAPARGEFTPFRDLIEDLADELNARGIKLFVYFAAEGPLKPYNITRPDSGQVVYPSLATGARLGLELLPDGVNYKYYRIAYSDSFRDKWHAMIHEWSMRWGPKVAGWWIDGMFGDNAYRTVSGADNGNPVSNLNDLVAAIKAGNANALVALNPGADVIQNVSENQDYMAGESARYYDGKGKFYEIPYQQFSSYGSNTSIQNHYYSYLGTWWNREDRKYVNEELVNYVSSVNQKKGVVTIGVTAGGTGLIPDIQMAQLERVREVLRPNMALPPDYTPDALEPLAKFTNLALYKPAWLMRHNYNYGQPHLVPGTEYQKQPHAGVDGDSETWAKPADSDAAGYTFGWSYIVDLESAQVFDKVAVLFPDNNFSTSYKIEYSADGVTGWQVLNSAQASYTNSTAGLKVHDAYFGGVPAPVTGRFLRITSSLPTWPVGTSNYGMGVAEFGVYNVSGTLPTSKETIWVDEEFPITSTTTVAGAGGWGTACTSINNKSHIGNTARWWSTFAADGVPLPLYGAKLHWNKTSTGHNEHGFQGSREPLRVGANDTLYCDVYLDPNNVTSEILLTWKDDNNFVGQARWGSTSLIPDGGSVAHMGSLPSQTGEWVRLSVPAASIGAGGKSLTGMSYANYGGRTFYDRAGKLSP